MRPPMPGAPIEKRAVLAETPARKLKRPMTSAKQIHKSPDNSRAFQFSRKLGHQRSKLANKINMMAIGNSICVVISISSDPSNGVYRRRIQMPRRVSRHLPGRERDSVTGKCHGPVRSQMLVENVIAPAHPITPASRVCVFPGRRRCPCGPQGRCGRWRSPVLSPRSPLR